MQPLNNIKITNYFKYERRYNCVFSSKKLPGIKDGSYTINLDNKNSKPTITHSNHWVLSFIDSCII